MKQFNLLFLFVYLVTFPSFAQGPSQQYLDMIGYEELLALFNDFETDSITQKKIILTYRNRAIEDGDSLKIARSYDRLARIFEPTTNIKYADTLIDLTKNWDNVTYPALAYILKGFEYGRLDNIKNQYESLSMALELSKKNKNISQQLYVLDLMIYLRATWGDVFKAIELQKQRHSILLSQDILDGISKSTRHELHDKIPSIFAENIVNSYKSFVHCYVKSKNYKRAESYIDSIRVYINDNRDLINLDEHILWILDSDTELGYWVGDFERVLNNLARVNEMLEYDEFPRLKSNIMLFGGLTHFELKNYSLSKKYLEEAYILKNEVHKGFFDNYDRLLYQGLTNIYTHFELYDSKVNVLNKLLEMDSVSISNYKYIEPSFIIKFETPELLKSKEETIEKLQLKNRNSAYLIIVSILVIVASSLLAWNYYRQKVVYRRRYERLMKSEVMAKNAMENESEETNKASQLSQEIIDDLLRKLEKFERNKDYLNSNISLMALAKKFNTNSSYLSRVLNSSKSINFSQYLNDLRIDYAVNQMKNDAVFRKYTIEAIATECGYNNSASFSRSFYKKTGLHPSYFIKEIIKDQKAL